MTAAAPRPMSVASGTLRFGFSMTPAETVALSIPMYAHSAIDAARDTADMSEPPLTFQPPKNFSESNQNQPNSAIARIGMIASSIVHASSAPTTRGPMMFANVSSQMRQPVAMTAASGVSMPGTSSERYPTAATAMAMFPIQLPNQ